MEPGSLSFQIVSRIDALVGLRFTFGTSLFLRWPQITFLLQLTLDFHSGETVPDAKNQHLDLTVYLESAVSGISD